MIEARHQCTYWMLGTGIVHSAAYAFGHFLGLLIHRDSSSWRVRPHVRSRAAPYAEAQVMSGIRFRVFAHRYNVLAPASMFTFS